MRAAKWSGSRRGLVVTAAVMIALASAWVMRSDQAGAGAGTPHGEGIDLVYIVVGTNFPDSLGVGPGAGVLAAPIILVPTNPPLPSVTAAELVRLDPRNVHIVGGTAVVSLQTEAAIAALLPNATIDRIAGANRYETNVLFSQATFPAESWVSVPASAFTSEHPADDAVTLNQRGWNETSGVMIAPIALPHGAEILEIRAHFRDTDGSANVSAGLYRIPFDGLGQEIAGVETSGTPGDIVVGSTVILGDRSIVDNSVFGYSVLVGGANDANLAIRNVLVRYRLGAPGG